MTDTQPAKTRNNLHLAVCGDVPLRLLQQLMDADFTVQQIKAEAHEGDFPKAGLLLATAQAGNLLGLNKTERLAILPPVCILIAEDEPAPDAFIEAGVRYFASADHPHAVIANVKAAQLDAIQQSRRANRRNWNEPSLLSQGIGHREPERLSRWLAEHGESMQGCSLLLIELKGLSEVNHLRGPRAGDLLLLRAARRLGAFTRKHELVGALLVRMSGSRFALGIAQNLPAGRKAFLAGEIYAELARPYLLEGVEIQFPAVVAIAGWEEGDHSAETIRRATDALARAVDRDPPIAVAGKKRLGASRYDEHQIEKDLHHAIGLGEIDIVLQPQFSVATGKLSGAEALARWNHAKYGALGAGVLFSVAERSGFLLPLSHHIHDSALKVAAEWGGCAADLPISVNVTPLDLAQSDFADRFLARIAETGVAANRVTIEITENGLMQDIEANARVLSRLRSQGIRIAADDFGTGYSSLAWLKQLPLDYLKLDPGLTADITGDARAQIIVRSIIAMAQALELKVLAEGIETEEQLALIAAEGCDNFQGFLRSEPLSPDMFQAFANMQD